MGTEDQCRWFSNNVEIPGEPSIPEEFYTVRNGGTPDVFATSPWRAPGTAPVYGSGCGAAGGGPKAYWNGGNAPKGTTQGQDGLEMPEMPATAWQIGSTVEVAWAISANHGGGYHYRLCKKSDGVSEECFQRTPLKFAGNTSFIMHNDGSIEKEFPMRKVTVGTYPEGSEWAMDPIPGCRTCDDAQAQCGNPLEPKAEDEEGGGYSDPWNAQVNCYGACCGSASSKAHGECPTGTEFYEPLSGHSGFGKNVPEWSIMDRVVIPEELEEGEYLLGWRWDCEESTQVWENCADIVLTNSKPPATTTPAPTPPPSPPAPSPGPKPPSPPKVCKANPQCSPFVKDGKGCAFSGCQECADDTTFNCNACCPGCEITSKGDTHYCSTASTII